MQRKGQRSFPKTLKKKEKWGKKFGKLGPTSGRGRPRLGGGEVAPEGTRKPSGKKEEELVDMT